MQFLIIIFVNIQVKDDQIQEIFITAKHGKKYRKKQFKKGTEIKIDANLVCFNRVEGHNFLYVFGAIKSNLGNVLKGM